MMMNINMKIKVKEEEEPRECSVDEDENDHLPISQLFQLLQQRHCQRQSLHSSSMMPMSMEIHDYPQKAARKRPRDKHSNDHVVKAVKRKAEEAWAKSPVIKRAEEVQANLSAEFPSFFKIMIPSVVCRGFWMSLPKEFCQLNLPSHDTTVILVDENGKEYRINFLVQRRALSGGWKKFSTEHALLVGDALVFHLIKPSKFKVYIVRVNGLAEVDAALGLLRLESSAKQTGIKNAGKNHSEPFSQDVHRYEVHRNGLSCLRAEENQSGNGSLDVGSREVEGIWSSPEINAKFKELRGIEKFTILVNTLALDSKLSKRLRNKYYELCCSQKSYLHENLHKNINGTLAADIITEIVNIADGIRASKISSPQADFVAWENTLSGFELLGMDVGFLRERVHRLLSLTFESKQEVKSSRYKEAKLERAHAEQEVRSLELQLLEKKKAMQRLDDEIDTLTVNAKRYKLMFEAVANAPW